jgi:DNA-binding MarR family transcriptional regulator
VKSQEHYEFRILNHIAENPDLTQADLATQLGVAVGSVNWYIKRLVNKGYIKVKQMERRRLRYLLTPPGVTEKARLMREFMQMSLHWYRVTRADSNIYLDRVKAAGFDTVSIAGDGDLAEIIALTCLERQVTVADEPTSSLPILRVEGLRVKLEWPVEQNG